MSTLLNWTRAASSFCTANRYFGNVPNKHYNVMDPFHDMKYLNDGLKI
jgi:hypothetical protein